MALDALEPKKPEPGFYSREVASVPPTEISTETLKNLQEMPGVETELEEKPGEKPQVHIRVNTIVLPEKK